MTFDTNDQAIWVCSDPHYSHKNLIKSLSTWESGAHRDFKSIPHHNDTLVNNINRDNIKNCFTSVSTRLEVQIDGDMFVMDHYPIREWEGCHKGWYMLYGHQHNTPDKRFSNGDVRSMDVGFDGHPEFRPYNIKEIVALLKNKEYKIHH